MASVQCKGGSWQLGAVQHKWRCSDMGVNKRRNTSVSASGWKMNCNAKSKMSQEALSLEKS